MSLQRPRFHLHFTPTYSSWIDQVERWFAELTRKQLRRGVHRSTRALKDRIRLHLATYNGDPDTFVWVLTADEILAGTERFCLRISGTGHRGEVTPSVDQGCRGEQLTTSAGVSRP